LGQGRYRIIRLAGKGGMALVYHAYDTQNDRDVAIKVLALELSSEENFLTRFQRESELMRDLDHPNILRAYDYGQEDERVYLVMSYYGDGTIRDRLSQGHMSLKQINEYLIQIASGLDYAHSRHIVHRDIKPSNVLIHHASGKVVLSDFGIAKALSNVNPSRTGTIMGTPLYMAPEQFLDRVDQRSDIYSLGIMLYQMLSGEVPFQGDGIGFKHLNDPVPSLRTHGIPPVVERVVMKALAKRPEARFQTAGAMAAAFEEAITLFAKGATQDAYYISAPVQPTSNLSLNSQQARLTELQVITPSQLPPPRPPLQAPSEKISPNNSAPANGKESSARLDATTPLARILPQSDPALASEHQHTTPLAVPVVPQPSQNSAAFSRAYAPLGQGLPPTQQGPALPPTPRQSKVGVIVALVVGLLLLVSLAIVGLILILKGNNPRTGTASPTVTALNSPGPVTTIRNTTSAALTTLVSAPAVATTLAPTTRSAVQTTPPTVAPGRSSLVAFTSRNPDGSSNIFLYEAQTGQLSQLTFTGTDAMPVWSSDGSFLVFQRNDRDLYRMLPDGTGQAPLLTDAVNPDFSHAPNPSRMVYVSLKDNELYLTNPANPAAPPTRLTSTGGRPKYGPVWSFDDSRIVFAMEDDNKTYQVYVLDLTQSNTGPVKLTNCTTENCLWPTFSPDGRQIAYSTNDRNPDISKRLPLDIWVMNADGTSPRRIVGNLGRNSHPVWVADSHSKNGSRIYFNSDRGPDEWGRIWVMNPDGSEQQLLIQHKSGQAEIKADDFSANIFPRNN
jgi:serine/threonine protein kinase/Tol biopolymer transport system component